MERRSSAHQTSHNGCALALHLFDVYNGDGMIMDKVIAPRPESDK